MKVSYTILLFDTCAVRVTAGSILYRYGGLSLSQFFQKIAQFTYNGDVAIILSDCHAIWNYS